MALLNQRLRLDVEVGKEPVKIQPGEDSVIDGEYDRRVCHEENEAFPNDAKIDWYLVEMTTSLTWVPPQ